MNDEGVGFTIATATAYDREGNKVAESKVNPEGKVEPPLPVPADGWVNVEGIMHGPLAEAVRLDSVSAFSIANAEGPCPHQRPSWRMCPHCLGLNRGVGTIQMTEDMLKASQSVSVAGQTHIPDLTAWRERVGAPTEPAQPHQTVNLPRREAQVVTAVEEGLRAFYEQGYIDGGNSNNVDWSFALTEYCELPEGVDDESPKQVAEYIAGLQMKLQGLTYQALDQPLVCSNGHYHTTEEGQRACEGL